MSHTMMYDLQAAADLSIAARTARIRNSFDVLPRWVRRQVANKPTHITKGSVLEDLGFSTEFTPATHVAVDKAVTGVLAALQAPVPVTLRNGVVYVPPVRKVQAVGPTHEELVIARVEIAELAQPATPNTKLRILKWMESPTDRLVSMKDIQDAFPEVAKSGVSSRVSELVKAGALIVSYKDGKAIASNKLFSLKEESR